MLEVQRRFEPAKLRTWRLYLAHVEQELEVSAALLIYVPRRAVAQRYRRAVQTDGISSVLRPAIISASDVPLVTDAAAAADRPGAAVLGILAHAAEPDLDDAFPALAALLAAVDPVRRPTYHDIVLAGLPAAARSRWRDFMTTTKLPYLSEEFNAAYAEGVAEGVAEGRAEGVAEGRAEGVAEALLAVLAARGVTMPESARRRIAATRDLAHLETWLDRALVATSIDDVIGTS